MPNVDDVYILANIASSNLVIPKGMSADWQGQTTLSNLSAFFDDIPNAQLNFEKN